MAKINPVIIAVVSGQPSVVTKLNDMQIKVGLSLLRNSPRADVSRPSAADAQPAGASSPLCGGFAGVKNERKQAFGRSAASTAAKFGWSSPLSQLSTATSISSSGACGLWLGSIGDERWRTTRNIDVRHTIHATVVAHAAAAAVSASGEP